MSSTRQEENKVMKKSRYATAKKVFGILFVLSFCILLLSIFSVSEVKEASPEERDRPTTESVNVIFLSLLSSLISLLGFLSTTILGWRREKREMKLAELEKQRKEIEIEKMRFELKKIKAREEERQRKNEK